MAVIKNKRILKFLLMIVVSLFMVLDFSIGVSASSGYDRQEADACITISERLSVKGGSTSNDILDWSITKRRTGETRYEHVKLHEVNELFAMLFTLPGHITETSCFL